MFWEYIYIDYTNNLTFHNVICLKNIIQLAHRIVLKLSYKSRALLNFVSL
jgi:fructose-1,6-bisphosphatase